MSTEQTLRERKKQQTRELIATTANRLFVEKGFDEVTVAEVARAANISEGTVFNYFPTKEDLFYGRMEVFEAQLVDAVRSRPSSEPVLAAFRRHVLEGVPRLARNEVADQITTAARVVSASATLQAHEREVVARYTDELATILVEEAGGRASQVEAWTVANALMGAQRALVTHVHASILAGKRGAKLASDVKAQGTRAFARLERGLADYGLRR
jgi:AcrR family transcriptional regulator